ncbi:MAG TPA: histidine kinase [Puia sp.]|nr:histidine kinase [Puia sp.]
MSLLITVRFFAQTPDGDSLKFVLPHLKDSARIDCLNELSLHFIERSLSDSAIYYAEAAHSESKTLGYIHGIAASLAREGMIKTHFYNDYAGAEKLDRQSIDYYRLTDNKYGLTYTCDHLAYACFSQGEYDEAMKISLTCYDLCKNNQDVFGMSDILILIAQIHLKRGEFVQGFESANEALQLAMRQGDSAEIHSCLINLGSICMGIEDYSLALNYYRTYFQNYTAADLLADSRDETVVWTKMEFAEIYSHLNKFDSALLIYNSFDTIHAQAKDLRIFLGSKGEYFMLTGENDKALPMLLRALTLHRKFNDVNEIVRIVLDVANTYNALDNINQALLYAREGVNLGLQTRARQRMRDAYKLLYSIYDSRRETDSAYFYYRAYIQTKESLTDDQTKGKFAANEYLGKIERLNSEKLISQQRLKIQDQRLKNESQLRNILIAFIIAILVVSILFIRNTMLKRRNDKLKSENIQRKLLHDTSEIELQALRAQMNPHFIFNCLNSINRFIMKNEPRIASDYLTQFSRLIRFVLNNSKKSWVPLEDEIDMLKLYLDMERLRFKNAFSYQLICDETIDPLTMFIPPLLLQPFVENAIWHGLMHKKENGLVTISFRIENDILHCTIIDNGVGRSAAAAAGSKSSQSHKSLGIQIARERLALINGNMEDEKVAFDIEDMFDNAGLPAGTKVSLKIRFRQNNEVMAESHTQVKWTSHD